MRQPSRWLVYTVVTLLAFIGTGVVNADAAEPTYRTVSMSYVDVPPFPAEDCLSMASAVLTALAIKAGTPIVAKGNGASYSNVSTALGLITVPKSSARCTYAFATALVESTCRQANGKWWNYKTMVARTLIRLATGYKHDRCRW